MSRSTALLDALSAVGIDPCGDNSCIFGSPGGMATNGGCRCFGRGENWPHEARMAVRRLAIALRKAIP